MKRRREVLVFCAVAGIALASLLATSFAQDAETSVGDDESGRLPAGYSVVVKKSQRKAIYAIQDTYQKQIDVLNQQIAALEKKRDAEIDAVLSDEQRTILAMILKLRSEEKAEEAAASAPASAAESN
jgi:TolA-binding protein